MTSVKQTPPAEQPEASKPDFTPTLEPSEPQPSAREQELLDKIAQLEQAAIAPSETASAAAKRVKAAYKVPAGEEGYHHVLITHQNGVELEEPIVKAFEPHQYETSVAKFPGFKGDIIHKATKK